MERRTEAPRGFRPVPRTGVIFVMTEARRAGFDPASADWANLGQGAPETGPLDGGPARVHDLRIGIEEHEYAPVDGLPELKQAVADLYNRRYRQGKSSQYSADNVAVCAGGRLALARVVAALGRTNVGHFLPDYTAYEELLDAFGTFSPIPILLDPERGYDFTAAELREEILGRGLSAVLRSNPSNPTGKLIQGDELAAWVQTCTEVGCTLILDEFYSHYVFAPDSDQPTVSAAAYVDDVNDDPVIILDGVTKNWRYPGWRLSWTVAPEPVIRAIASVGSFLDGGAAHSIQRATLPLVASADDEASSIRTAFKPKRDRMRAGLEKLGIPVDPAPEGGFYCWGSLAGLPVGYRTGSEFFRAALQHGVIVVPGRFFDINPGQRRPDRASRFQRFARFSFGPEMAVVERGLERLGQMLSNA